MFFMLYIVLMNINKQQQLLPLKFKVHKDLIENFHLLRFDFSKKQKIYSLSNNKMFSIMVNFLHDQFDKQQILKKAPAEFIKAMVKPGRRKATSRNAPFPLSDSILFTVESDIIDKYINVMYSYILNDKEDSVFNDHHSRTYFFYDFIDYIKLNKKEFLKFQH